MSEQQQLIETAFESGVDAVERAALVTAVDAAIALLDRGEARVAEPGDAGWRVNQWLKKAVLLSFRLQDNDVIEAGYSRVFDKVGMK